MKYLTDKEILNWNKRLEKSSYSVYPMHNTRNGNVDIIFRQKINQFGNPSTNSNISFGIPDQFVETVEPSIMYDFIFSVSANRKRDFLDLFEKLSRDEFGTKYCLINSSNDRKIYDISFTESVVKDRKENIHKVYDKEYVRFTYRFDGKLGSIMAYISYLEDAINYISEMWGYNEDGSEVCLLKYPIGTIVSLKDDKSKNYLVLDYKYKKWDNKYTIDFVISEMLTDKSTIIKYGEVITTSEEFLCYSRDSRIDDILN